MVENILDRTEEATSPPGMEELPPPGFQESLPPTLNNDCIHNIAPPIDHGIMHHQMSQQVRFNHMSETIFQNKKYQIMF